MENLASAITYGLAAALITIGHGLVIVPRLPEPPEGAALGKMPYAKLSGWPHLTPLIGLAVVSQLATVVAPLAEKPLWLIYGSAGAALIWVDAKTTWIPTQLCWLAGGQMVAAMAIGLCLTDDKILLLQRLGLGALAAWLLLLLSWLISQAGIGFGDVRLAPLIGAMAGLSGFTGWFLALISGSALGVIWGLLTRRRRPAPGTKAGFAFGPALWAGPYLAFSWLALAQPSL